MKKIHKLWRPIIAKAAKQVLLHHASSDTGRAWVVHERFLPILIAEQLLGSSGLPHSFSLSHFPPNLACKVEGCSKVKSTCHPDLVILKKAYYEIDPAGPSVEPEKPGRWQLRSFENQISFVGEIKSTLNWSGKRRALIDGIIEDIEIAQAIAIAVVDWDVKPEICNFVINGNSRKWGPENAPIGKDDIAKIWTKTGRDRENGKEFPEDLVEIIGV